ncbi:hypothetical protein GobsT_36090 [Gemmata obscuriglobus]|uniref:DUF4282 domain-containing protein n=1 Tax=Gemmata obscuriglobus TaxID=114 RepID=A0A2Z3HAR7_9BACT|nr:DUF4282 domain-containing protein [Gemmata obscuriglobus]AWM38270.1 DUF4282 domain-containing protein [Gemmata obscuriglobus]QEG28821.1 hypothetical protein GobsT_36090 [Gemmata obscuriglobus]VTS07212.1 Uncharacterized conserved protein OS=Janthinobacterium sp. (strain Marseille) GN=mma_3308 PE=4 SV=1: DUF4282 [Gemmata obscuriglobus UQM 2246]
MKNTCPKCNTAYNVTAAAVGRRFTCKNCGTPVVVREDGLDYQSSAAPPAAEPAPAGADNAFDFNAGDEERPPAKSAKKAGRSGKSRPEDDEFDDAPRKAKSKKPPVDDDVSDDDAERLPARKAKPKGTQKNALTDFLLFREFIAPLFVKLIFFLSIGVLVLVGLASVAFGLIAGKLEMVFGAICSAVIFLPLSLLMVRVYCELVLLGFSLYDRLGEIKNLLEKGQATTPAAPPGPPTP